MASREARGERTTNRPHRMHATPPGLAVVVPRLQLHLGGGRRLLLAGALNAASRLPCPLSVPVPTDEGDVVEIATSGI